MKVDFAGDSARFGLQTRITYRVPLMFDLFLLIPDPALHDAVAEQLAIAKLGTIHESAALPDQAPTRMTAVILDEAACDVPNAEKLRRIKNDHCVVLLLGAWPHGWDESLFTESFIKPIRLGYLITRLHFYTELAPKLRSAPLSIGSYKLEAQQRCLVRDGETIRLTEKETALLEYLAQSSAAVGREELLAGVWGYDARIDTHTLETHIYQLRRKIGNELIVNENGLYRLGA